MATEKLIPQYLNKDEDERLVKPFEMTDALNIRVSHEDGGDQGIVKNVEGNEAVSAATTSDAIPSSGDNRVIGAVPCEAGKCIYFFLYNSNLNHGIYRYDSVNDNYVKLYEGSVLNFERDGFVKGDVVINQFQEHLLYFTDNRNEPRKVNATRLLYGGYNSLMTSGTDEQKNKYLTVCKQPPQDVITWAFQTNSSIKSNHLKESCFQFAYQYVYDDGEISAVSAYSSLAVSSTHLAYNSAAINHLESFNNELLLTVSNSDGPVDKIRVFARRNNDGAFQKIEELNNDSTQLTQSFVFRNDRVYPYVSSEETNKLYDAVPRASLAQAVSNGRLIYGNYIEGFDNLVKTDVYNYPVYHKNIQVATEVDFEIVDHEPMNEVLAYDDTDEYSENLLAYAGGEFAQFYSLLPTITAARFGDSTTNGISFDIDLSEFPVGGIQLNGVCSIDISVGCDKFGFVCDRDSDAGQNRFSASATTFDEEGDAIHTQDLFFLDPESTFQGMGNLVMESPCQFVHQFPLDNYSTVNEFAAVLVNELNNNAAPAIVGLSPSSHSYGDLQGSTVLLAGTTGEQGQTSTSANEKDRLIAWMSGTGLFDIAGAAYNEDTQRITCKIRCIGVELSADAVIAPYHYTNDGAVIGNDFVHDTYISGPTYQQEQHGGCIGLASYGLYEANNVDVDISTQQNSNGFTLRDYSVNDGAVRSYWNNYSLKSSTIDLLSVDGDSVASFKAGATHDFGIVYYDDRNRPSGVQPIDEKYVRHFGDGRQGNNGRAEIDFRLLHDPPSWASKWAPVYSKNTSYDKVIQLVVNEAASGKQTSFTDIRSNDGIKTRPILQGLDGGVNGQIFLSLRGLEGKSNSYRDFKGANISYEYNEGDILRVLQYEDPDGNIQRPLHEFTVTSYKYYQDDENNPIRLGDNSADADETNYRRSGWFLTIRDNQVPGFSRGDVLLAKDFFSQNCLVEICTPKKETSEEARVYYEVKKQYDILEVGGVRTHAGDRSNSTSPVFGINVTGATSFKSSQRLYLGDKVVTADSEVFLSGIRPLEENQYAYSVYSGNPFSQSDISSTGLVSASVDATVGGSNSIHKGVVTLTGGDVFLRVREQLSNSQSTYNPNNDESIERLYDPTKPDNQIYRKWIVEDEAASDFFDSKASSIGRPFIETPDQKEIRRHTAVTYSAPFVSDSSVLNLSSFNPLLYPYKDYNSKHGAVCYLIDKGEGVFTMQEKKVSTTPIGRQLIESSGDGMLVTSTNVLGTETYFAGSFGPGLNPESVVERFGATYFCDMDSGKVFALSSNGIEPISDKSMSSLFEGLFADLLLRDSIPRIPCGIDPENDEFVVTTESQDVNDITIDSNNVGDVQKPPTNARVADPSGKVKAVYGSSNMMTWDKDSIIWSDTNVTPESYRLEWDSWGESIMFVDKLTERGSVFIDPSKRLVTTDIKIDILTSDGKYRGVGLINPADGSISFPSTLIEIGESSDSSVTISVTDGQDDDGNTLAYSTTKGFWLSFYSFNPELYTNLHNRFFSFENGQMYRHNVNDTNNNFYGTQYDSMVELVSRQNPSTVKVYNAIGLEGDSNWDGTISNSSQTTNITAEMFENREGMRYTVIPKDISDATSDSSGSNIVVLGEVDQLSGSALNQVRFKNRISNLPFGIGDEVRILSANSSSATGRVISKVLDRKTIQLDGSGVGTIGATLIAVSNDEVNGDHMRDYYAKVKLTNDSTSDVELYAVNMNYTPSPLHDEGQPAKQQ